MIGYRIKIGPYFKAEHLFAPNISFFDQTDSLDLEQAAMQAAEDFQDNHDGWELWKEGDVDMEMFDPGSGETFFECKVSLVFEPTYEIWGVTK